MSIKNTNRRFQSLINAIRLYNARTRTYARSHRVPATMPTWTECEQLEPRVMLSGVPGVDALAGEPDQPNQPSIVVYNGGPTQEMVAQQMATLTTTASDAPIYPTGLVTDGGAIAPQSAQSGPLINIDDFRNDPRFAGIDGSGFSTVIIDTGIDLNHPFFGPDNNFDGVADRIVYHQDFADGDMDATDVDGHGSNVASLALSQDPTLMGMAPGADIIALKVFQNSGGGLFSYTEAALQWVVANAATYNIASVNLSLSDSGNHNTATSLFGLGDELAALASMDIIVASASSNDFFGFASTQGVGYPSADPNSLSVGAVYDANIGGVGYGSGAQAFTTGADRITPFSQRHTVLTDVFAPGAASTGANQSGGTVTMHGTSQASPHIAGIATLAQQYATQTIGRRLTLAEFRTLLDSSGVIINDGDDENDNVTNTGQNFRRVDVHALGNAIAAMNIAPDRFENNDTFATATNFGTNADRFESSLTIDAPGDDDFYRFTTQHAGNLDLSILFNHSLGDLDLYLYNASQQLIDFSTSQTTNEHLDAQLAANQTYYVRVHAANNGVHQTYYLDMDAPGGIDGFEDNDSYATARGVASIGDPTYTNLTIDTPGDEDYYKFTAQATGNARVDLDFSHAQGDLELRIYRDGFGQIADSLSSTDDESATFPVIAGSTYVIWVHPFGNATNPDYAMHIDMPGGADAYEANDSLGQASNLGTVTDLSITNLTIHASNNEDYFSFMPATTGLYEVDIAFLHSQGDLELHVMTAGGQTIASSTSNTDNESIAFQATMGQTYVVRIDPFANATNPDYTLLIGDSPTITAVVTNDTGASSNDAISSQLGFSGTIADRDQVVQLIAGINDIPYEPIPFTNGAFTITQTDIDNWHGPVPDGQHTLNLLATDAVGHATNFSLPFVIDTVAPTAPGTPDLLASSDTGANNTDNITSDNSPTIRVTGEADSTISLFVNGVLSTQGVATAGTVDLTIPLLPDGTHQITATATDIAGNTGPTSTALAITIDTTPPATPAMPDLIATSDSGSSDTDDITNDNTPTVHVDATAGDTVTLFVDGVQVAQAASGAAGVDFVLPTQTDGAHQITATATNPLGTTSAPSPALNITIDTQAPTQPGIPDLLAASDSGSSDTDNITNNNTPTIHVQAQVGTTLHLQLNGVQTDQAADNGTGANFVLPLLIDGGHQVTVSASDVAGNTSTESAALSLTIDTAAPITPTLGLDAASDTAPLGDNETTLANVTLVGQTEPGVAIALSPIGANDQSDGAGNFTFAGVALNLGANAFGVTATDTAGNQNLFNTSITRLPDAATATITIGDAVVSSNPTGITSGFFDVLITGDISNSVDLAAYTVVLDLLPTGAGVVFTGVQAVPAGVDPAFPGGGSPDQVLLTASTLGVADDLASSAATIDATKALFRATFDVQPGVIGTFNITANPTFTSLTNALGNLIQIDAINPGTISVVDPPAVVSEVYISGTTWSAGFLNEVDPANGMGVPMSPLVNNNQQLATLPWINSDQVKIRFNEAVNVTQGDLSLRGVNVSDYAFSSFSYDPATFTATWTLDLAAQPDGSIGIGADRLLIDLEDTVTDTNGTALDGEWANPLGLPGTGDSFPSGDGAPGGDFLFRFDVLPGNVDLGLATGPVLSNDLILTRNAQLTTPGQPNYSAFRDVNGDGVILSNDVIKVRNRQLTSLPGTAPTSASASPTASRQPVYLAVAPTPASASAHTHAIQYPTVLPPSDHLPATAATDIDAYNQAIAAAQSGHIAGNLSLVLDSINTPADDGDDTTIADWVLQGTDDPNGLFEL